MTTNEGYAQEVKMAYCTACRRYISVDASLCVGCGHPITPETREAMIQDILTQRENDAKNNTNCGNDN
jgi:hypothetical protein